MTVFYFDLVRPTEREPDDVGVQFDDVDQAYLEACRAAIEISKDALLQRQDPNGYRFEVFDEDRRLVCEIPFSEVLRPGGLSSPPPLEDLFERVQRNIDRGQALKADLAAGFDQARQSLSGMRALMRRGESGHGPRSPSGEGVEGAD